MERGFDLLKLNHAGVLLLKNGETINYGVKRRENDSLVYYTGKGLREMFSPNLSDIEKVKAEELKKLSEEKLIDLEYIAIIPLSLIDHVID